MSSQLSLWKKDALSDGDADLLFQSMSKEIEEALTDPDGASKDDAAVEMLTTLLPFCRHDTVEKYRWLLPLLVDRLRGLEDTKSIGDLAHCIVTLCSSLRNSSCDQLKFLHDTVDVLSTFCLKKSEEFPFPGITECIVESLALFRTLSEARDSTMSDHEWPKNILVLVERVLRSRSEIISDETRTRMFLLVNEMIETLGVEWLLPNTSVLLLLVHLVVVHSQICLDKHDEKSTQDLAVCFHILEMAIKSVEESSVLDDSVAMRVATSVREAALYSAEYWVKSRDTEECIGDDVEIILYRFLSCYLAIGGADTLPPELGKQCSSLILEVFHRVANKGDLPAALLLLPQICELPKLSDDVRVFRMIILSEMSEPSSGVRLTQPQVVAYMEGQSIGEGRLCVAESQVTWICRTSGLGFSLTYPSIILHAISTDLSTFPHECIYVLVDASKSEPRRRQDIPLYTAAEARNVQDLKLADEELANEGSESGDDDDDEGAKNVVIRFVPADLSVLQQIYTEMCNCQELNPDENDDYTDEDGGGDMIIDESAYESMQGDEWYTAENIGDGENIELSEEGRANLRRMLNHVQNGENNDEDHDENEMDE
ncbi:hypothetical protein Q1695_006445 [Nippostrongylus brasiliensis]|nr:hypothetical protein Q1695_006445 [Nippostrongylus brasiliensis]